MAEDKREKILAATLDLVVQQGFHGTPAAQIAQRAGVGVGTIYRYFKDKDELIHALYSEVRNDIRKRVAADLPDASDLKERFFVFFAKMLHEFIAHPREFRFLEQYHFSPFSSCYEEDVEGSDDEFLQLLRGLKNAELIKDLPRVVLKALTFGPLSSLAREHDSRPFQIDEAIINATVQACWDAIKR